MRRIIATITSVMLVAVCLTGCGSNSESESEGLKFGDSNAKQSYKIGETWEVEGEWSLEVTDVTETSDRNPYSDKNPGEDGAVYIISYTYTNIGYIDEYGDGLFFSLDDSIVDSEGNMGSSYPGDVTYYPQETPIGANCKAQCCIMVEHKGDFEINVEKYDSTDTLKSTTFKIEV